MKRLFEKVAFVLVRFLMNQNRKAFRSYSLDRIKKNRNELRIEELFNQLGKGSK